jgi:hypothetical protein
MSRCHSCPMGAGASPRNAARLAPNSPSLVDRCSLQARDVTKRGDCAGYGAALGTGEAVAGAGKQLLLVKKTLHVTGDGHPHDVVPALTRAKTPLHNMGVTMVPAVKDVAASGLGKCLNTAGVRRTEEATPLAPYSIAHPPLAAGARALAPKEDVLPGTSKATARCSMRLPLVMCCRMIRGRSSSKGRQAA